MMTDEEAIEEIELFRDNQAYSCEQVDCCNCAISALRERIERRNPRPLTLDELYLELHNLEKWLWCVDVSGNETTGWYKCEKLISWADITKYGKTWIAYSVKPNATEQEAPND